MLFKCFTSTERPEGGIPRSERGVRVVSQQVAADWESLLCPNIFQKTELPVCSKPTARGKVCEITHYLLF